MRQEAQYLFHNVPGRVQQTTPFVGGLQQVMPFLPVGGPMQSNSYVFGASMSPGGFAVPMSPAFGDARGGLVAGNRSSAEEALTRGPQIVTKKRTRFWAPQLVHFFYM